MVASSSRHPISSRGWHSMEAHIVAGSRTPSAGAEAFIGTVVLHAATCRSQQVLAAWVDRCVKA